MYLKHLNIFCSDLAQSCVREHRCITNLSHCDILFSLIPIYWMWYTSFNCISTIADHILLTLEQIIDEQMYLCIYLSLHMMYIHFILNKYMVCENRIVCLLCLHVNAIFMWMQVNCQAWANENKIYWCVHAYRWMNRFKIWLNEATEVLWAINEWVHMVSFPSYSLGFIFYT